ncbi:MAG TPA: histidine triad nucleotide-binding protein [Acidocella sp.]|uniref:histidine triad nucleotide-binding protein n=1 Tax=Acidocella sp. TaxID=50710 RepID=UPI002CFDED63|nr:histidine triad nucleotide-binding protein [Acidocella sp.]HVE22793.1 histidine triad nucleotide-binding protein [Acidocella sp.]
MATYDDNNIFARILRGEIPCQRLYEDEFALAFPDIKPQAPCHVLVIPKGKYVSATDFGAKAKPEEITGFYRAVSLVAEKLGVAESGYRLIANAGPDSRQEVPHFHVHILGGHRLGAMLVAP